MEITFARLFAANVHDRLFCKLQKRPFPTLKIITGSVIAIHYSKYSKLLEDPEDQLILDNNEVVEDARNTRNTKKVENIVERGETKDVGKVGNIGDTGDAGDIKDKKAGRSNKRGDQEESKVSNNERSDGED